MDTAQFDFVLPQELIALRPASPRDSARLLVVHSDGRLEHAYVHDLTRYFHPGDVLVAERLESHSCTFARAAATAPQFIDDGAEDRSTPLPTP